VRAVAFPFLPTSSAFPAPAGKPRSSAFPQERRTAVSGLCN
jgi:hypothetical protein